MSLWHLRLADLEFNFILLFIHFCLWLSRVISSPISSSTVVSVFAIPLVLIFTFPHSRCCPIAKSCPCPLAEPHCICVSSLSETSPPVSFNFQHPSLSKTCVVSEEIHNKNFIARWWGRKVITDFIRLSILWIFIDRSEEHFTHWTDNGKGLKGVFWRRVCGIPETSCWDMKPTCL